MNVLEWWEPGLYVAVFVATVIEGEAVFLAAAVLAHSGRADPLGVFLAAALGGSIGDQIYFYLLRGRFSRWLDRFPRWAARRDLLSRHVAAHSASMILACRFLPGLRVAIPAACALGGVSAVRFTTLSLISSLAWATSVLALVAWLGPAAFAALGVHAWWTPVAPAAAVLAASWWLARRHRVSPRPSGPQARVGGGVPGAPSAGHAGLTVPAGSPPTRS